MINSDQSISLSDLPKARRRVPVIHVPGGHQSNGRITSEPIRTKPNSKDKKNGRPSAEEFAKAAITKLDELLAIYQEPRNRWDSSHKRLLDYCLAVIASPNPGEKHLTKLSGYLKTAHQKILAGKWTGGNADEKAKILAAREIVEHGLGNESYSLVPFFKEFADSLQDSTDLNLFLIFLNLGLQELPGCKATSAEGIQSFVKQELIPILRLLDQKIDSGEIDVANRLPGYQNTKIEVLSEAGLTEEAKAYILPFINKKNPPDRKRHSRAAALYPEYLRIVTDEVAAIRSRGQIQEAQSLIQTEMTRTDHSSLLKGLKALTL
ncbi:MAG: hypothetical protein OXU45_07625 [Candidatus Melainabacteria bacterium]|nr:hypothetical protein [Candidatus Melainabacteria bacterium]